MEIKRITREQAEELLDLDSGYIYLDVRTNVSPPHPAASFDYRTRTAFPISETASTTLAFLEPFTVVW